MVLVVFGVLKCSRSQSLKSVIISFAQHILSMFDAGKEIPSSSHSLITLSSVAHREEDNECVSRS